MSCHSYGILLRSAELGRERRIDYEPLTRAQTEWMDLRGRCILWRAANQVGKSRGLAKKLINFITCRGAYSDRRPGPVKILVVSISKEQMEPLHSKIWELLPKHEIDPGVEFVPGKGFRGKPPVVTFTSGKGRGSVVTFATYAQGSQRVAGGTYDIVACDEPLPERVFGEVQPRVLHGNPGEIWITFTPTPDSPPLDYLRKRVDAGDVKELRTSLTVENVTLLDREGRPLRPLLTQAQIDTYAADLLDAEKDMRLHGGWDIVVKDRMLTNWGPACVGPLRIPAGVRLAVGIDHGAGAGKEAAVLLAIHQEGGEQTPRVWILEEYVSDGYSTPEQDAAAILAMLGRRGWGYDAVDSWVGDRATGLNRFDIRKTNRDLESAFAHLMRRDRSEIKRIVVPKKWGGSVGYGYRMVNAIMGRRDGELSHFRVDPKCEKFANAALKWRGANTDILKDILDAARYAVEVNVLNEGWFAFQARYA